MHSFITGAVNVPDVLSSQGGEVAISLLLDQLPAGRVVMAFFLAVMAIFLAAHMDAVGYAVSATCTRDLKAGEDPSPFDRLFWCVMLRWLREDYGHIPSHKIEEMHRVLPEETQADEPPAMRAVASKQAV